MTDPSAMPIAPFRFLDLPTELRLEVYKHVAKNTHQRRFFSDLPVSFSEADFSILACCRLVYTEAYECMRNARLDQPPTIKLVYDEKRFGLVADRGVEFVTQALRQVTEMLISGRKSDYSDSDDDSVPMEPFSSIWRDLTCYHSRHKQNMGSAIDKASLLGFYRMSILQMRLFPYITVEVVPAPGARPLGNDDVQLLLYYGIGGTGLDARSCIKVTFVFVVPPEHVGSFQPEVPPQSFLRYSAVCERAIQVMSDGSGGKPAESGATNVSVVLPGL